MGYNIPLSKPLIEPHDVEVLMASINNNFVGSGEKVKQVTQYIDVIMSTQRSFLVNSGSSAIFLSLKALGVQSGDEVLLSAYSCVSIYNQIVNCGAIPKLVQPLEGSFFNDPEGFFNQKTYKTKAIIFYHPFGHFDTSISKVKELNIPIIEDITHSWSSADLNIEAGKSGDIVVSSLGSTKLLTSGTGGTISVRNERIAQKIEKLLDHDFVNFPFNEQDERYNLKLGDLNASLLISQLNKLEYIITERRRVAKLYSEELQHTFPKTFIPESSYFRFFIQFEDKNKLDSAIQSLSCLGIGVVKGGFKIPDILIGNSSNASAFHAHILGIPIYPNLALEDQQIIIKSIKEVSW